MSTTTILSQTIGLLALHFVWFGAILPCLWKDNGFGAILHSINVQNIKINAFNQNLPVHHFSMAASLLHTVVILLAIFIGHQTRALTKLTAIDNGNISKFMSLMLTVVIGILVTTILYLTSYQLFQTSHINQWQYGFQYSNYFFNEIIGSSDFAKVTATSLCLEFVGAYIIRVSTLKQIGLFPKFASKAVPRSILSFVGCYCLFRHVLTPRIVRSLAAATGLFNMHNIEASGGVTLSTLDLEEWCVLAAAVHTLCIALGMTFHWILRDIVTSCTSPAGRDTLTRHTTGILRFVVSFVATVAFFSTLQMWLAYATVNDVQFAQKSTTLFTIDGDTNGIPSSSSVAVACACQTLAFLIGIFVAEGVALPTTCTSTCNAFNSRNLKLRPAAKFIGITYEEKIKRNMQKTNNGSVNNSSVNNGSVNNGSVNNGSVNNGSVNNGSVVEGLLLAGTAVLLALYVADHHLLGITVVEYLEIMKATLGNVSNWGPDGWKYLYSAMSRDQLFFFTLPVLLVSEIPLWFFTIIDYLQLRCADKYRIHYSKIEKKRPRNYPTNVELWKAFKVHCINFFGIYCSVFVLGVGFACQTNIVPYSFSKELPSNWLLQFILCSFCSDVLFYVFHRAVHSKGLYQRLHKMHHEYIYTIALAHHYMDPLEATIFMLPPIIPPILMGSHITVVWAMVLLTQFGGIMGHSAFLLPIFGTSRWTTWIPFLNSQYHDLHHLRFNVNYGAVWPIVDMLFGTYREEPIILIDGYEDEEAKELFKKKKKFNTLNFQKEEKKNMETKSSSSKNSKEEDDEIDADDDSIVYETAEGARSDNALPDIPWYLAFFVSTATSKKNKVE